jgi:hypothetical protein
VNGCEEFLGNGCPLCNWKTTEGNAVHNYQLLNCVKYFEMNGLRTNVLS